MYSKPYIQRHTSSIRLNLYAEWWHYGVLSVKSPLESYLIIECSKRNNIIYFPIHKHTHCVTCSFHKFKTPLSISVPVANPLSQGARHAGYAHHFECTRGIFRARHTESRSCHGRRPSDDAAAVAVADSTVSLVPHCLLRPSPKQDTCVRAKRSARRVGALNMCCASLLVIRTECARDRQALNTLRCIAARKKPSRASVYWKYRTRRRRRSRHQVKLNQLVVWA